MRLFIFGRVQLAHVQEPLLLIERVVQFGEGVAHLEPADEELETLHVLGVPRLCFRQGRDIPRIVNDEGRLDQRGLDGAKQPLVNQIAPRCIRPRRQLTLPHRRGQFLCRGARRVVDPRDLEGCLAQRHPSPGRAEIDPLALVLNYGRAKDGLRSVRNHLLGQHHHVAVIEVGCVELQLSELGVVLVGDALVPEVVADLVDTLVHPHQQPLKIEFERYPQVEVLIELVVVRSERPGRGPAVDRLQDGRLYLEEAPVVEEAPQRAYGTCPNPEHLAHVSVGGQVRIPLPESLLDIGECRETHDLAVLLSLLDDRQRADRLGEHRDAIGQYAGLTAARTHHGALGPNEVSQVEVTLEHLKRILAQLLDAKEELDQSGPVVDVSEDDLAHRTDRANPARHRDARHLQCVRPIGLSGLQRCHRLGNRMRALHPMRVRLDARGPQPLQLLHPLMLKVRKFHLALAPVPKRTHAGHPGVFGVDHLQFRGCQLLDLDDPELQDTVGGVDLGRLPDLAPEERAPQRRLVGDLAPHRVGLGGADEVIGLGRTVALRDGYAAPQAHRVARHIALFDDDHARQQRLELHDAALNERLLIAGVLQLGILQQLPLREGAVKTPRHLLAFRRAKILQLLPLLRIALTGQERLLISHDFPLYLSPETQALRSLASMSPRVRFTAPTDWAPPLLAGSGVSKPTAREPDPTTTVAPHSAPAPPVHKRNTPRCGMARSRKVG